MQEIEFDEYVLLIGLDALELFDFFKLDHIHGLNKFDCFDRIHDGGTYIDGLTNFHPYDNPDDPKLKPFVFLNLKAFVGNHEDVTLIMHEIMHLSLLLYDWTIEENEESIVSFAEAETNYLITEIFKIEYIAK